MSTNELFYNALSRIFKCTTTLSQSHFDLFVTNFLLSAKSNSSPVTFYSSLASSFIRRAMGHKKHKKRDKDKKRDDKRKATDRKHQESSASVATNASKKPPKPSGSSTKLAVNVDKTQQSQSKTKVTTADNASANRTASTEAGPTMLIAPQDYINIYSASKNAKGNVPAGKQTTQGPAPEDDTPTIMIAPQDCHYVNFYSATKNKSDGKQKMASTQAAPSTNAKRIPSDDDKPTILIAPEDYEHIYSNKKTQPQEQPQKTAGSGKGAPTQQKVTTPVQAERVPSDAPTVLIAPEDLRLRLRLRAHLQRQRRWWQKKEVSQRLISLAYSYI